MRKNSVKMAEIWVWLIQRLDGNIRCNMKDMKLGQILKIIFQSVYYRLKISKKDGQFFFRFLLSEVRFDES